MSLDIERVRQNAAQATTEDLLDRVTVFRGGMEPDAIEVIEAELQQRGVTEEDIKEFGMRRRIQGLIGDEVPRTCSFCHRPAVAQAWGFAHRGSRPSIFPWRFSYCQEHLKTRWQVFP